MDIEPDEGIRKESCDLVDSVSPLVLTVPVQILFSQMIKKVAGSEAPPCPVNAQIYADAGLPFFSIFEETPFDVSSAESFAPLRGVDKMQKDGWGLVSDWQPMVNPRTVKPYECCLSMKMWLDDVLHVDQHDGLWNLDSPH